MEHSAAIVPDAEGRVVFDVPSFAANRLRRASVRAEDPNYRSLDFDLGSEIDLAVAHAIDVQVIGLVTGRVVDGHGAGVGAVRIRAFVGTRNGPCVDQKNSAADGSFRLAVPPGASVLLLAEPMQPSGARLRVRGDGEPDTGEPRSDLLPTVGHVTAHAGGPTAVADLVLAAAAMVTGSVRWRDGEAIANVRLAAAPVDEVDCERPERGEVELRSDGQGAFTVAGVAGEPRSVRVHRLPGVEIVGADPVQTVRPPARIEFALPRPIVVRAVRGAEGQGEPVPFAVFELGDAWTLRADGRGQLALLLLDPELRLRARAERGRSAWTTLTAAQAGATVDLPLRGELGEVAIEFTGERRVRNVRIGWHRDGGATGAEAMLRDDRPGPFRLFLEPGHYQLTFGPAPGEASGLFLLPSRCEVDVTAVPQQLTLPASFGGRLEVDVRDGNGLWLAGTCRIQDATGRGWSGPFRVRLDDGRGSRLGVPDQLLADGPNTFLSVLPPGDYTVDLDLGPHGRRREQVAIEACATRELVVRVP